MATITRSTVLFWLTCILLSIGASPLLATILTTNLSGLALEVMVGVQVYAREHNGMPPKSWEDLRAYQSWGDVQPYLDFDHVENSFKMFVQSTMMLLGDVHPTLEGPDSGKIVAMTAFGINEDRREEIGRYVVVQRGDGTFTMRWVNESAILKACSASNLTLPPAAVFQESPLRIHSLEYQSRRMWRWVWSVVALIIAGVIFWKRRRGASAKFRPAGHDRLEETKDDIVIKW